MSNIKETNDFDSKTVVVNQEEIDELLRLSSEAPTVLDRAKPLFEPEVEAILRETDGYEAEPTVEPETESPLQEQETREEPAAQENAPTAAEIVAAQKAKKKKRAVIICVSTVAVLAAILAALLIFRSGNDQREYDECYAKAQTYYSDGDYDKALDELRQAMGIDKTDECLLLMSQCYEAKHDYVNAIAILESSSSDSSSIKRRIQKLEAEKEEYDKSQTVQLCGSEFPVNATEIDLSGKSIRSSRLKDIERLTELTSLKLADNDITELDFLRGLTKLVSLDLSDNSIEDLSPLADLTSLRTLHLDNNEDIEDFEPLYGLDELTTLTITGIEIGEKQLEELKEALPGCIIYSEEATIDVVDVKLGGKTFKSDVTELDLSNCGITDISALSVCINLERLNLSGNYIRDISCLVDLPALKSLNLSNNKLSDVRPLMSLTALEYLNLEKNGITSVTALAELSNLKELQLGGNQLKSFVSIAKISSLKTLGLDNTGLTDTDLEDLYDLKSLTMLSIKDLSTSILLLVDLLPMMAESAVCRLSVSSFLTLPAMN